MHPCSETASPTKATTGIPQLSEASVTCVISGAGTGMLQPAIDIGSGLDAVGGMLSPTVIVCVTSILLSHSSVTLYVRVMISGQEPPSLTSLTKATTGTE